MRKMIEAHLNGELSSVRCPGRAFPHPSPNFCRAADDMGRGSGTGRKHAIRTSTSSARVLNSRRRPPAGTASLIGNRGPRLRLASANEGERTLDQLGAESGRHPPLWCSIGTCTDRQQMF